VQHTDSPYLENVAEVTAAAGRRGAAPIVAEFIERRYGITDFTSLVERHLPRHSSGVTEGLLPRQIPMPSVEAVTIALLARTLDLSPLYGAFTSDTFTPGSVDKSAAAKVRTIDYVRSRSGTFARHLRNDVITDLPLADLNRRVIADIRLADGGSLVEKHRADLERVVGAGHYLDVTEFMHACLIGATTRPATCFVRGENGTVSELPTDSIDLSGAQPGDVRPPSGWYYPIMFALTLDRLVMFESYESARGSVSHIKGLFEETSKLIAAETGLRPRIVRIAPLDRDLTAVNARIVADGADAFERLTERAALIARCHGVGAPGVNPAVLPLANAIAAEVVRYGSA
jgi:hypothetical protein